MILSFIFYRYSICTYFTNNLCYTLNHQTIIEVKHFYTLVSTDKKNYILFFFFFKDITN